MVGSSLKQCRGDEQGGLLRDLSAYSPKSLLHNRLGGIYHVRDGGVGYLRKLLKMLLAYENYADYSRFTFYGER
jgi:hypothetical protein